MYTNDADRKLFSEGAAISITFTAELQGKPQSATVQAQVQRLLPNGIGVRVYQADALAVTALRAIVLAAKRTHTEAGAAAPAPRVTTGCRRRH